MSKSGLLFKAVLAVAGCFFGVYVGQALLGGALGWAVTGAIVGGSVYPLFKTPIAWRETRR